MARHNLVEVLAGALVLLLAGGFLAYAVSNAGGGGSSGGGYLLHARFDRVDGLEVGADVRVAGVKVGTVTAERIDPVTYLAWVTLRIDKAIRLPTDTSAEIATGSLLGSEYLSLSPGGSDKLLAPGQTITITQGAISLEELLGKFIFSVTNLVNATKPKAGGGSGGP